MKLKLIALVAAGIFTVLLSRVEATPIQGTIDFGGVATFDTPSLATATRVTNWQPFQNGPNGFSMVLQSSGDFAGISAGTQAAMASPWIFNPSTSTPSLWSVGGFTFDLTSSVIASQDSTFLDVEGVGTITSTKGGLDPTPGTWSFTSSDANGQNQATFSFQSNSAAVPEPSSFALLSVAAMVGAAATRRVVTRHQSRAR